MQQPTPRPFPAGVPEVTRRGFLGALGVPAAAAALAAAGCAFDPTRAAQAAANANALPVAAGSPEEVAVDEDFWAQVAQAWTVDRSLVNLNNGGVSPSPGIVQAAVKRHMDYANSYPSALALLGSLQPQVEAVREKLAAAFGADPEELALTRNSSESLQICQLGLDLQRGDEVLASTQDYPRMITAFRQRERREGIVLKQVVLPVPAEDPAAVVALYEQAITPRTKLILMCHMINLTGQILPVKQVVAMARARGIPVIVDGAHALAHVDFQLRDLDCDYYGVSLHKWLAAPHGTGLLYVRREKIAGLWPLMAAGPALDHDIRKFEEIGTQPLALKLGIAEAVDFHVALGGARKAARLVHLRDLWARRLLAASDRVVLHTSLAPGLAGGLANVELRGVDTAKLQSWLWDKHRILVTAIVHPEFSGLRVTPQVYTTPGEIDRFCAAMEHVLAEGLPA
ncbi:MAG TPA: aminotransferase class V-fold PLP-dependent enzyme [Planctomycetota bacterium]|nr:aminotransferase class V-fold PLP-dependent enzyme [Planctomycetota bacterium]